MKAAVYLLMAIGLASFADAATAFWAFQESIASGSAYRATPNVFNGFLSTPTITKIDGVTTSSSGGGQNSFIYNGEDYRGSNDGTTGANSFGWNATGTQNFTGAGFTLGLDLTGLSDLTIAFSMRSAGSGTTPPLTFKSIEYIVSGGEPQLISSTLYPSWVHGGGYQRVNTIDLSSLAAIEGQSSVQLRFLFADTANSVDPTSLRIDNLVLTAVPEPSSILLGAAGLLGLAGRRRR